MFTPMLPAPGSGCAELEGRQKWVVFTQLQLRKLISERPLGKNSGHHGSPQPLLPTPLRTNLRRHGGQVMLSDLGSPRSRPKSRFQAPVVYLGGGPRKHRSRSGGNQTGRQGAKGQFPLETTVSSSCWDLQAPVQKTRLRVIPTERWEAGTLTHQLSQ